MGRRNVEVKLPSLHGGGQHQAFYDQTRFKILVCGRRWGKSLLAAVALIECAAKGGYTWWVYPSFPMAMVGWRRLVNMLEPLIVAGVVKIEKQERMFVFPNGGYIQMKSAEKPKSLRGEGLDLVVIDEWAYIKNGEEVWESDLRPSLSEKMGGAYLITSPNGMDYVYKFYHLAKKDEDYKAYHFPTWTNPFIPATEIEAARKLPDKVFRQEYGAEFVEGSGAFFTNMDKVMRAVWQDRPIKGHYYRGGLDVGRWNDRTVLSIVDMFLQPNEICYISEMENMTFREAKGRILEVGHRFDIEGLMGDRTGIGYGLLENVADDARFFVDTMHYSNKKKLEGFTELQGSYEMGDLLIPDLEWLKVQHQMMVTEIAPGSLTVRLNAKPGFYDDGPNSIMLADKARKGQRVTLL